MIQESLVSCFESFDGNVKEGIVRIWGLSLAKFNVLFLMVNGVLKSLNGTVLNNSKLLSTMFALFFFKNKMQC